MTVPQIRRGGEGAAEEAAKAGGGKFAKIDYFQLEKDKNVVLRFLTDSDDWFYVKQHPSVPTKNKPNDFKGNWPQAMPGVCRHDAAFTGIYDDCYICDTPVMNPRDNTKALKAAVRVWALAVEREAVVKEGKTVGYRNAMKEVEIRDEKGEPTGKTEKQVKIVVVNMGMKNFFSGLQGIYGLFNTVCDRDMLVRRTGEGLDTDYQIIPLDKIESHVPGTDSWAKYDQAVLDQNLDLNTIIAERASDDYYARFFDPSKTPAAREGDKPSAASEGAAAAEATAAANEPDADRLKAMAARVRGTGANAAAETPAAETAPAAEATEAPASAPTGPQNFDD